MRDLSKFTKKELLDKCKEHNILKCSSKTKPQLIELLSSFVVLEPEKPIVPLPIPKDALAIK